MGPSQCRIFCDSVLCCCALRALSLEVDAQGLMQGLLCTGNCCAVPAGTGLGSGVGFYRFRSSTK